MAERSFGYAAGDLGVIVLLREVRQYNKGCTSIIVPGKEFREFLIRQVPHAAHNPLFYGPWIRSAPQHFQVMIGLQDQHIGQAQMIAHAGRHVSQVGSEADLHSLGAQGKPYGIGSVMRDGEGSDLNIADSKPAPRGEKLDPFGVWRRPRSIANAACPSLVGGAGHEYRNPQFSG